jgi:hypothetical protein
VLHRIARRRPRLSPPPGAKKKSIAVLEFELLSGKPYFYSQEELQFEVHLRRRGISASELKSRRNELWAEFFEASRMSSRVVTPHEIRLGCSFRREGKHRYLCSRK